MKNLGGAVEDYCGFLLKHKEDRSPDYFEACLADAVVGYWRALLFVPADNLDHDDATKAEELLIHYVTTEFNDAEKTAIQNAAQRRLRQSFTGQESIDPEDESLNREQRFLTFIATGRFEDMDLL